jgi:hypothetical protein
VFGASQELVSIIFGVELETALLYVFRCTKGGTWSVLLSERLAFISSERYPTYVALSSRNNTVGVVTKILKAEKGKRLFFMQTQEIHSFLKKSDRLWPSQASCATESRDFPEVNQVARDADCSSLPEVEVSDTWSCTTTVHVLSGFK